MFFFKNCLKIESLRIGKHRIVKNIAWLRKVNIAHPYMDWASIMAVQMSSRAVPLMAGVLSGSTRIPMGPVTNVMVWHTYA